MAHCNNIERDHSFWMRLVGKRLRNTSIFIKSIDFIGGHLFLVPFICRRFFNRLILQMYALWRHIALGLGGIVAFFLPFGCYKRDRCPRVVCWQVLVGSYPGAALEWAILAPTSGPVGGLHLRPRLHTESVTFQILVTISLPWMVSLGTVFCSTLCQSAKMSG